MKYFKQISFLLIFLFLDLFANAQSNSERFAVQLRVLEYNNIKVKIYEDKRVIKEYSFNKNEGAVFTLSWNFENLYFEISKIGYVTQRIQINSVVPDEYDRSKAKVFDAGKVKLYEEVEGISNDFYNKPIAFIHFNEKEEKFEFKYDNRQNLEEAINRFLEDEKNYDAALKEANSFFQNKEYEKALEQYQVATELKPNESFPKQQLSKINKLLQPKTNSRQKEITHKKVEDSPAKTKNKNIRKTESAIKPENKQKNEEISLKDKLSKLSQLQDDKIDEKTELLQSVANIYYNQNDLYNALSYFNELLNLNRQSNNKKGTSNTLNQLAIVELDSGRFENAILDLEESINILKALNDIPATAEALKNLGKVFENTYRFSKAISSYNEALSLTKSFKDKEKESFLLNSLASVHTQKGNYNKAIDLYNESIGIEKKLGNEALVGNSLNNLGLVYYHLGELDKANDKYEQSMKIADKLGNDQELSVALNNMGNVNYDWEKYAMALKYYEKSLKIKENLNMESGIAISLYNIGNVHKNQREYTTALDFFEKSKLLSEKIKYSELISKNLLAFSDVYSLKGEYKKALNFYKLYTNSLLSLTEQDKKDQMNEILLQYEVEKSVAKKQIKELKGEISRQKLLAKIQADRNAKELKIKNLELKQKEDQIKSQRLLTIVFSIGFVIVLIFLLILTRLLKQKSIANKKLATQRDQISEQNKEITDSIKYAERIQTALLPHEEVLKDLPEHFILFKPKDIVSGDFYWTAKAGDKHIVAAVDCTGHGVPGAFMSMLGISYLNEIISKHTNLTAGEILDKLRDLIIKSLHQTDERDAARDGMDLALCIINEKKNEIEFAGAFNPLFLIRNKELTVYKADKMPIGIHALLEPKPFKNNVIKLDKGDCIYMFSDGYMDQFHGVDGKKFMSKKFKELLTEISDKPMPEQRTMLDNHFIKWKLDAAQTDDVLVFGIRF